MDAAFTEEQHEIRRTLRELLHKRCGPDEVKAAVRTPPGYDEQLWHQLAARLGLPGLALPTAYGGVGCGPTELALACEETGRVVLPSPLIATAALAAPLILALGSERQRSTLLPALAAGEMTATLAVPGGRLATALALTGPNDGDWAGGGRAGGIQARQVPADGGGPATGRWRLYGEAGQVLNGHTAQLLVVAAHTGGFARSRTRLFLVRADAGGPAGLLRIRQTAMDETRPQARLELREVPAELLGEEGGDAAAVPGALAATGARAAAALAAEAVGVADAALARTVGYVREREQFGRPIGSFQAVQHRLADLYVALQAARSAAYYAAWSAGRGPSGGGADAAAHEAPEPGAGGLALAQALETLRAVAAEAVQLHGGIGFTWEHAAHLYFKRAACDELLLGPVHRLRARAAAEAGLFPQGTGTGAGAGDGPVVALRTREGAGA
ncbi:acyl-CoA dehydrogenase family protein [Streptomyces lydicus]|uniref:Acyl-CoA dehydrogenase n=1 Tax=Streptomyces lydicus TaxID=47763 RepID=A0A1D7VEV4_9ACTN|nr:acyl-CoA dehydrogenase family protein [Streptomyces lydicus]AOP45295.1 acyl-CoA dehydrogenase [Streptomyces lydicus]